MNSQSIPAVGIDLGTTFSVIAHLDDAGRPVTLVNAEGERTTPSLVLIDGSDIVVGREALRAIATEAEHVADCVKRDVGQKAYHRAIDGRYYPPEVLHAAILKKLAGDAQRQVGPVREVVITVPAYFDEVRRKSVQDAGYIAGLEVMDIINEPTAAAIAYGYAQGFLTPEISAARPQNVVVYDLGGGTFDVTVMEIAGNRFRALATDGDVHLGGRDFDQRIVDRAAEAFAAQYGADPRHDPAAGAALWLACEDAKRILSSRPRTTLAFEWRGCALGMDISREAFEEWTADLLDRTRFTTRQALQLAGLQWQDVDRVLLVGGSSRMPMVHRMLRELAGKDPETAVHADEAVAQGAALHAGLLLARRQGKPPAFRIKNINSHSLGLVGVDRHTGRRRAAVLIPRNTPLPAVARRTFKTKRDGQDSVVVCVVEGESRNPDECLEIGHCAIKNLPPGLPKGSPVNVEFRYGTDGRLSIAVELAGIGRRAQQEIVRPTGLTTEHLDRWRQWLDRIWPN
jgi:molecular chaperone DnaK